MSKERGISLKFTTNRKIK